MVIFHETQHTEILGEGATTDVVPSSSKPVSEMTTTITTTPTNEPQVVKTAVTLDEHTESKIAVPSVSSDELHCK